jgi:hypothetical protein
MSVRTYPVKHAGMATSWPGADAGLSLWLNALRALDALGVGGPVRGRATLAGQAGIRDVAGRWLSRSHTAELERRYEPGTPLTP